MKTTSILCLATLLTACNPERGKPRGEQLEATAEKLEAKAGEVLDNVEQSANEKEQQASEIREVNGDEKAAEKVRDRKEDLLEARP